MGPRYGILAPAASYRDRVVPVPAEEDTAEDDTGLAARGGSSNSSDSADGEEERGEGPVPTPGARRGYRWAEMMQRVFAVDVLECGHCGGRRRVLQFLTNPEVIEPILRHLGFATEVPRVAPARGPPEPPLPWS